VIASRKSLFGTVLLLLWVTAYALVIMAVMATRTKSFGPAGELAFYALAGMGWVPVSMMIIKKWMAGEKKPSQT
jgi:hypothetical protein